VNRNGPLIFSMWIRPSCTASVVLAISNSLRAAFSGSAKERVSAYFIVSPVGTASVRRAPSWHTSAPSSLADCATPDSRPAFAWLRTSATHLEISAGLLKGYWFTAVAGSNSETGPRNYRRFSYLNAS
jgi:hypothetical protein